MPLFCDKHADPMVYSTPANLFWGTDFLVGVVESRVIRPACAADDGVALHLAGDITSQVVVLSVSAAHA